MTFQNEFKHCIVTFQSFFHQHRFHPCANVDPPDMQLAGLPRLTTWLRRIAQKLRSVHVDVQLLCNANYHTRALLGRCLLP